MSQIPPRLRWACRRGMLELDVLLGGFLENAYVTLSPSEQDLFVRLLDCNDQELFEWFTKKAQSTDLELMYMVEKVLDYARNKH